MTVFRLPYRRGRNTVRTPRPIAHALRAIAREEFNRKIVVLADLVIASFPSDTEAKDYAELIADHGDTVAAENNMAIMRAFSKVWTEEQYERFGGRFMQSYGCAQAVGSPPTIAKQLVELSEAGVDGIAFSIMGHWEQNLQLFADEVIPRLDAGGNS